MLPYCQLDPQEQMSVKFESKYKNAFIKLQLNMSSAKWRHFFPGGDELITNIAPDEAPTLLVFAICGKAAETKMDAILQKTFLNAFYCM